MTVVRVALVALVSLAACRKPDPPVRRGPWADYCTLRARCEGGNARDINACQVSVAGTLAQADAFGCHALYDALLQCMRAGSTCVQGHLRADCAGRLAAANACLAAGARDDDAGAPTR